MAVEGIVYHSSAGTTERYARRLAEQCGLPALPLRQAKKELAGRPVLFMSWICSGTLMNCERAKKWFDVRGVCAVGIGTEAQARRDLHFQHELEDETLFFLPGAFNMKKLKLIHRRTMKDMEYALATRVRDPKRVTQADRDSYNMLKNGADHYDEKTLEPALRWIAEGQQSLL